MNENQEYSRKMEIIGDTDIYRLKVPDGWLVSCFEINIHGISDCASIFVPDENHEWIIENEYPRRCPLEIVNNYYTTYRMKLPNGWIVIYNSDSNSNMVYVSDANHKWILEKE